MLIEQYLVLMIAGLVALYLGINSNNPQKRLVNSLVSIILNSVVTYTSYSIEIVKVVEDSSGQMVADALTYSNNVIGMLFLVLTVVSGILILSGAYKKLETTNIQGKV
jgi:hypothetical protein